MSTQPEDALGPTRNSSPMLPPAAKEPIVVGTITGAKGNKVTIISGTGQTEMQRASKSQILVEGLLWKQKSGPIKGWNERWFRLMPIGLYYYKTDAKPAKGAKPAGMINIVDGKYFRAATVNHKVDGKLLEHAIEIRMDKRAYILLCNDVETRNKWLRGLTKWQKLQREGLLETKLPNSGTIDFEDTEQSVSKSKSKDDDEEESKTVRDPAIVNAQKLKEISEDMATLNQTLERIHNKLRDSDEMLIDQVHMQIQKFVSKAFDGRYDHDNDQSVYVGGGNHSPSQSVMLDDDLLSKIQADWTPQQSDVKSNVFYHLKNNQRYKAFMTVGFETSCVSVLTVDFRIWLRNLSLRQEIYAIVAQIQTLKQLLKH
jgi:hypothetical protein